MKCGAKPHFHSQLNLTILGVLLQQPLVNLAFDVDVQPDPRLPVDQLHQPFQLGGVLDLVLRLAEDDRDQPRAQPQCVEDLAVVTFQLVTRTAVYLVP